jgi:hypothetical protein
LQEVSTYRIVVKGRVDERAFNAASPQQATVVSTSAAATRMRVCADQAGLIGVLRHLHRQGYELISLQWEGNDEEHEE